MRRWRRRLVLHFRDLVRKRAGAQWCFADPAGWLLGAGSVCTGTIPKADRQSAGRTLCISHSKLHFRADCDTIMCEISQAEKTKESPWMSGNKPVPDIVVGRLPVYLRELAHLLDEGQTVTASKELAGRLGMSSAQIRKDLSHFGEFGKQGMGYDIAYLREQLRGILKVDCVWDMALVGAGDLGHAIAQYGGFEGRGFRVSCVFDNKREKIGRRLGSFEIRDATTLGETIRQLGIRIAIVAVPAGEAQKVVDNLVDAGVRAVLNYAPITVTAPPGIYVQHIDPVIHLQHMTYHL
jgi:redox-sensing transcriptional repressor